MSLINIKTWLQQKPVFPHSQTLIMDEQMSVNYGETRFCLEQNLTYKYCSFWLQFIAVWDGVTANDMK